MADINNSIQKLIKAMNANGRKLLYHKKQFMGREGSPHNYYTLSEAEWNADKSRYDSVELYGTTSTVRMVLYLRDMWFELNGWDLPIDNEQWNEIRAKLRAKEAEKNG